MRFNYYAFNILLLGKEIETLLKTLGITLKDLPPITQRHIEVLAEAALDLQVKDTSPARYNLVTICHYIIIYHSLKSIIGYVTLVTG